jgi:hypothetical protein
VAGIILATQEADVKRTVVQSQLEQKIHKILSRKNPSQRVAQGVGLESNQYHKKKKKKCGKEAW